ncbi:hypothetical protein [Leptolyngbya iicbica]|nr:hypothetical protein [Leptolyngbya sp. LK]
MSKWNAGMGAIAAKYFAKASQFFTLELFYGSQWQNLGQIVAK